MQKTLVCLHGWGGSSESFTELRAALDGSGIAILTPDLPGFGTEPEPAESWTTDDYVDWMEAWIKNRVESGKLKVESGKSLPIFLLGHSHGGRIALKLAYRQSTANFPLSTFHFDHLFLCAAAGIKHPRHVKRIIGLTLAKSGKALLAVPGLKSLQPLAKKMLYKLVRVHDYEKATPLMRETLIRVSQEDLRPILKDIRVPTDIFWGKDDRMTPFSDALLMQKSIPNSTLLAFDGVRHRVHRDRATEISAVIRSRASAGQGEKG